MNKHRNKDSTLKSGELQKDELSTGSRQIFYVATYTGICTSSTNSVKTVENVLLQAKT